jgi:hypothetical protein
MSSSEDYANVSERYTLQERQSLKDIINERADIGHGTLGKTRDWGWIDNIMNFTEELVLTPSVLSKKGYNLLLLPLEEMPLHINEVSNISSSIAIWRLELEK